jgi:hypothetical protein
MSLKPVAPSKWAKDKDVDNCTKCNVAFGFLTRRHHCRICGNIYCDACSKARLVLWRGGDKERVCDLCMRDLMEKRSGGGKKDATISSSFNSNRRTHTLTHSHTSSSSSSSSSRQQQQRQAQSSPEPPAPKETVLYETRTICGKCSVLERRDYNLNQVRVMYMHANTHDHTCTHTHMNMP